MTTARAALTRIVLTASLTASSLAVALGVADTPTALADSRSELVAPPGTQRFGSTVRVLPNGNYVIGDNGYDLPGAPDAGAVFLYDGRTNQLISTLTGSATNDRVGIDFEVVGNSNVVVGSYTWNNGAALQAGAVTWINGTTGLNGVVSAANSLVGTRTNDYVGSDIRVLTNGNFVTSSYLWDSDTAADVGSVTWVDGNIGVKGLVTAANSMIGTTTGDEVGLGLRALTNGHYIFGAYLWDNAGIVDAGAATWGDGTVGSVGVVGPANSMVGSHTGDHVGDTVVPLPNGNWVTATEDWGNGISTTVGAVTWRPGTGPAPGVVSAANSLVGSTIGDEFGRVAVLTNGNYVAYGGDWDDGLHTDVGAATWGNGATGTNGVVSTANSFVGSLDGDGQTMTVWPLTNGSYVITAPVWDDGATLNVGAVTWRPGDGPAPGAHSVALSLIGSTAQDLVGGSVLALTNGNYVVGSPSWHFGATGNAGAATWGSGTAGVSGTVSGSNSLIGTQPTELVGTTLFALSDGNYVAGTYLHDAGALTNAGAVTWRPGNVPAPDVIAASNSVLGTSAEDRLGSGRILALPGGAWVMGTQTWDNAGVVDAGAVTRYAGGGPVTAPPSLSNSLVGSNAGALVGRGLQQMPDGSYVVYSPGVANGSALLAGAITWVRGALPIGPVSASNSLLGDADDGLYFYVGAQLSATRSLVVGRPQTNHVSLITPTEFVSLAPARLADTRPSMPTVDGAGAGGGPVGAGTTLEVAVSGRGGVAIGAPAVALNVTVAQPQDSGFVTVYPCGETRPLASNLNYTRNAVVPNAVMAKVGVGGKVCVFTSATTDLVVDVDGYFPSDSAFVPSNPARLLDTRPEATVDGLQQGGGKLATDQVLQLQVGGRAGVPATARSVALNVTVTEPDGPGFITVFPCGGGRPLASSLNFVAGSVVANLVVSDVGPGGTVCLYTSRTTHLVADVNGWFPLPSGYRSMVPARLLDSRAAPTIDGLFSGLGVLGRGTVTQLQVTGRAGVPGQTTTAVLNVTATESAGGGFVTVYPCGIEPPVASNLNYVAGSTVPNAVVVQVGSGGRVCLFNSEATHLVVDIVGFLTA